MMMTVTRFTLNINPHYLNEELAEYYKTGSNPRQTTINLEISSGEGGVLIVCATCFHQIFVRRVFRSS